MTGTVAGAPDLTVSYDRDTGVVQVWQAEGTGARTLLDTGRVGPDGRFYDGAGTAIGVATVHGAVVDPVMLPGYRAQTDATNSGARVQTAVGAADQPRLCPAPGPDQPGAPLDNPYQQYIGQLINGQPLPPGLAVSLWSPLAGKLVHFDDCQLSTGIMIEAKGTGYADILADGVNSFVWGQVQQKMINQANLQIGAAQGRPIEWYFAESTVADYMRKVFNDRDLSIAVIYMPVPR